MKQYRIYIVDDDSDDLEVISEAFTQLECASQLVLFNSVAALFKNLDNTIEQPDLIILDHQAPGTTGGDAVEILRSNPKFDHTALVVYSSYITPYKEIELKAKGADLCFAKGLTMSEVRSHAQAFCNMADTRRLRPDTELQKD